MDAPGHRELDPGGEQVPSWYSSALVGHLRVRGQEPEGSHRQGQRDAREAEPGRA